MSIAMNRDVAINRLAMLRVAMANRNVDLAVIGPSADMFYLLGRRLPSTERFNTLLVWQDGRTALVVPTLQAPLAEALPFDTELVVWSEAEDPLDLIARKAADDRIIAVNPHLHAIFLLGLQSRIPRAHFEDAGELFTPLRMIKNEQELALMRDLGRRFDAIWEEFFAKDRLIGRTELQIARRIGELLTAHGFEQVAWCDVGSGPNGASPLHHWSDRVITAGDPVVIDFAGVKDGYYMDTCRTPVAGEPHPDFVAIYDLVNRAHEAAAAAARPGVPAEDVDRAARKVIEDGGKGSLFTHRTGHGLGIDAHEGPYIVKGNRLRLAPGMVFSDEPGVYVPGRWGVRIENILTVTPEGSASLNQVRRDLVTMN